MTLLGGASAQSSPAGRQALVPGEEIGNQVLPLQRRYLRLGRNDPAPLGVVQRGSDHRFCRRYERPAGQDRVAAVDQRKKGPPVERGRLVAHGAHQPRHDVCEAADRSSRTGRDQLGQVDLGPGEDRQVREAAHQVHREVEVAAGVLDAGDASRIPFIEAPNNLRRDRRARDVGEMIKVESEIGARRPIDDRMEGAEGSVFGDAAPLDGRRHQQHAVGSKRRRMRDEPHGVGNVRGADRGHDPRGRYASGDQGFEPGLPVLHRELGALAGGPNTVIPSQPASATPRRARSGVHGRMKITGEGVVIATTRHRVKGRPLKITS